jgi:hypothetical protein
LLAQFNAPAWMRGATLGLACGAHPTLILLAPLVPRTRRDFFSAFVAFAIAWLAMYGGVLLALNRTPSAWGDVSTLAGWWAFVSGQMYRNFLFALPLIDLPTRVFALIVSLIQQFTPIGALLAAYGFIERWRVAREHVIAEVISFAAIALFALFYDTSDSRAYLVIAMPIAAGWLANGIAQLNVPRWARMALIVLPILQLGIFWNAMNLKDDRTAGEWSEGILSNAPPRAIVLTERDAHTFALWYARDALGIRGDVVVLDRDLWAQSAYRKMMMREFDLVDASTAEQAAQQSGRPVIQANVGAGR